MAAMIKLIPFNALTTVFRIFLDSIDHIDERSTCSGLNCTVVRVALHGPNDSIETTRLFRGLSESIVVIGSTR